MKSLTLLVPAVAFVFASADQLGYNTDFDKGTQSLNTVACSDGSNGLLTRGFTTFGSLPTFPNIGAAAAIAGWNSPSCGSCWQLTYTNARGASKSLNVTAIDRAAKGFIVSQEAMDTLTNGQAAAFGVVNVVSTQMPTSGCGL